MKITKLKKIIKEELLTEDILCNKCGNSCNVVSLPGVDALDINDYYGLIEASVSGGYCSTGLEDGKVYTFSLCENCLKELFDGFKLKVQVEKNDSWI